MFRGILVATMVSAAITMVLPSRSAAQSRSSRDGIYTDDQAKLGATLYAENCAGCHAPDLRGTELAPPLTGAALMNGRWRNSPLGELFELMRSTMPFNSPG